MTNNIQHFLERHPGSKNIIGLYLMAWQDEFGKDIIADVSESEEEAQQRADFYKTRGYQLIDENRFGCGFDTMGIAQCFKKMTNI